MAMRREGDVQADLIVTWAEMPRSPGHAFYDKLQALLTEAGFDAFVEEVCKPYYAPSAAEWYGRAAAQGHDSARLELGRMYRDGLGVARDYQKALALFRNAAEQGNAVAQGDLGLMYLKGLGVSSDPAEAAKWFEAAAAQGNDWAQNELGFLQGMQTLTEGCFCDIILS